MWVNTSTTFTDAGIAFYAADATDGDGFGAHLELHLGFHGTAPRDRLQFFVEGGTKKVFVESPTGYTDGAWHHVAATWDLNGEATLYTDGAQVGSAIHDAYAFTCGALVRLGRPGAGPSAAYRMYAGLLDDVLIYSRVLSDGEVGLLAGVLPPVADLAGNALDGEYAGSLPSGDGMAGGNFVCTFRIDTTPPTVIATSPLDGAEGVSITPEITITFSEDMAQAATEGAFSTGPDVPGTTFLSGAMLTFIPSGDLEEDTDYTVTISTGAKDLAGHALAEAYTFTFTTEDLTAPVAVTDLALSPGDESIEITWRNPSDLGLAGVVILRNTEADPTGVPADGTAYTAGEAIGGDLVAYVGEGTNPLPGNKSSWVDEGLMNGETYHYAVFAFDEALNYSAGVTDSAEAGKPTSGGDGGLCTAKAYGSPLAWLALLSLFALAIARTRRVVRSSGGRVHGTS